MEKSKRYENMGTDIRWMKNLLFAGVFIQENRLHAVFDRYNEMSCKQWLLMVVCNAFETPPDLSTLAEAMGCSRQNVKKLAINLQKDGYITLEKSERDARSVCVNKTEKGKEFSKYSTELGSLVHKEFFKEFSEKEIVQYFQLSIKMMNGINHLEEFFKQRQNEISDRSEK